MMKIIDLEPEYFPAAIEIFADAFRDDPLFMMAFPESAERIRCTKIMYEFVVNSMVLILKLHILGAFESGGLVGCMIYSGTESKLWSDEMNNALDEMRTKANNASINLIGEFARVEGYEPAVRYIYGNELAVKYAFRGRGIGAELCNELVKICDEDMNAEGILIDTANGKNLKLYSSLGWELKQTLPFYDIMKYFLWRKK